MDATCLSGKHHRAQAKYQLDCIGDRLSGTSFFVVLENAVSYDELVSLMRLRGIENSDSYLGDSIPASRLISA